MASNTALVSAPLEEAAHIGHVDVLERSGESLTVSWRKPLAIGQTEAHAYHLELSQDPNPGASLAAGASGIPAPSPNAWPTSYSWREVASGWALRRSDGS